VARVEPIDPRLLVVLQIRAFLAGRFRAASQEQIAAAAIPFPSRGGQGNLEKRAKRTNQADAKGTLESHTIINQQVWDESGDAKIVPCTPRRPRTKRCVFKIILLCYYRLAVSLSCLFFRLMLFRICAPSRIRALMQHGGAASSILSGSQKPLSRFDGVRRRRTAGPHSRGVLIARQQPPITRQHRSSD
jgi:hypothetical protein